MAFFKAAVVGLGKLPDPLPPAWQEGGADVDQVAAGGAARQKEGGNGPQEVAEGGDQAGGKGAVVEADVEVAVAAQFNDPPPGVGVGGELLVVDRPGGRDVEVVVAGGGEPLGEVDLVRVDEEPLVQVADPGCGRPADKQGRGLAPVDPAGPAPLALHDQQVGKAKGGKEGGERGGEPPGAGDGAAVRRKQLGAGRGRPRIGPQRLEQRLACPRQQLGVLVEQQAELPPRLLQEG